MDKVIHESGILHATGQAVYVDDLPASSQTLIGKVVYSKMANGRINGFNLENARELPGVYAILSHQDIPGENQMGPVVHDQPALAGEIVTCIGQALFLIAAKTEEIALEAEKLIEIEYEALPAILSIKDAKKEQSLLQPPRYIECGNIEEGFKNSDHILEGTLETGAQEHWYLETQVCLCVPGENHEITAYCSTQNPTETQAIIGEVLGIQKNEVEVICRRIGGGFGGKETEANHIAAWAALLCNATHKPVKIRLNRDDDQIMTGKRHPFLIHYKVGFENDGSINAVDVELNSDGGNATDLSMAILERAMMHAENSYFIPNMKITGSAWKTNHASNTAFRGFGGPQGMACIETIIDRIARELGKDSAEVRHKNFYGIQERNLTPYGQTIENNHLFLLYDQLSISSRYFMRRKEIDEYNQSHEFLKKGMALTPVKFGISFTTSFLNQAGALVNIYKDGSVLVNQGGTEMGQGLFTKIRQIAALELGVSFDKVKVNATNTTKVPNTSPTAASSGTDMNGMAVKNAMEKLKKRIGKIIAGEFTRQYADEPSHSDDLNFENNHIFDSKHPNRAIPFAEAIPIVYNKQKSLSATGYYRTPDIHFDRQKGKGRPFHYFAFGMAVSEVLVDTLTGYHKILCTHILHDAGNSLNPDIDLGQIEGGFMQGVGWVTTEECKYNVKGELLNHSPDTYKIPGVNDIPSVFDVQLLQNAPNPNTIRQSKAVGEPPFMLAFSVWLAIKDAISAVGDHKIEPEFQIPATHEKIAIAIQKIRNKNIK